MPNASIAPRVITYSTQGGEVVYRHLEGEHNPQKFVNGYGEPLVVATKVFDTVVESEVLNPQRQIVHV